MKKVYAIASAIVTLGSVACGPSYDRTEIRATGAANVLDAEVSGRRIVVPAGTLVTGRVSAFNDDDETMGTALRSMNPDVLDVVPVARENEFAFLGLKPGNTQIEIKADGDVALVLDAVVTAQPSAP